MKLILLMYLEDDDARVVKMLETLRVAAYSRLSMEGHGSGMKGWYGDVAPYRSRLLFVVAPEDKATELLDAVRGCVDCMDPSHPIRALQVGVEQTARSGGA